MGASTPDHRPARVLPGGARGLVLLFTVAFVVRIAAIAVLGSTAGVADGAWGFGYEAACIARSLHEGGGFADPWVRAETPWQSPSGPTGWLGPVYPTFVAGAFALGGGLTPLAAWIVFVIQSALSALTCVLLARLGAEFQAPRAGQWAGWILAVLPAAIWNAAAVVWDTTFVAFGVVWCSWFVASRARSSTRVWAVFGAGFGLLLLVNAAPLALVPSLAWIAWRQRDTARAVLLRCATAGLVAFLVCLPWLARNQRDLGVFALRTNLGVELDVGNNDEANGRFQIGRHPSNGAEAFASYRALGEAPYAARSLERAITWIRAHPRRFVELCIVRATFFWVGVNPTSDERVDKRGLRAESDAKSWLKYVTFLGTGVLGLVGAVGWARHAFAGRALLLAFALFPLVYCATHALERYRHPIEPLLVLAAAWLLFERRTLRSGETVSSSR